jgi:tetratricopeptide (TPR) repeat protein
MDLSSPRQIGFADYYDGDRASCQRNVSAALIAATAATKAGDVGAEIFFLSTTANGLWQQGMPQQRISYATRAIDRSNDNPAAGYPALAYFVLGNSLLRIGKVAEAKQLSTKCLGTARSPATRGNALFLAFQIAETAFSRQ